MRIIKRLFELFSRKKYAMPYERAFIKWTDVGEQYYLPEKSIILIEGNKPKILPYLGEKFVDDIRRVAKIPVFDMTFDEPYPRARAIDIVNPAKIPIRRI